MRAPQNPTPRANTAGPNRKIRSPAATRGMPTSTHAPKQTPPPQINQAASVPRPLTTKQKTRLAIPQDIVMARIEQRESHVTWTSLYQGHGRHSNRCLR